MQARRETIRSLMVYPSYFALPARERLILIRKVEAGLQASTIALYLRARNWVKTGKIE